MPTIETKIWLALRGRVESIVLSQPLPVLWPGQTIGLPAENALEVAHMVNRPARRFIGSDEPHDRRGILQIGLLSTLSNNVHAETVVRQIAGTIADHFPADLKLTYADVLVRIYEAAEVGTSFKDEARNRNITPVSIRWQTWA